MPIHQSLTINQKYPYQYLLENLRKKYSSVPNLYDNIISYQITKANDGSVDLPYEVNWRWHSDLSKCDWYDIVKLFGQKTQGNWSEVIGEVKEFLQNSINRN